MAFSENDALKAQPSKDSGGVVSGIAKNSLCPCGSGEKYKRCCLETGRFELREGASGEEVAQLEAARLMADIEGLSLELMDHVNQSWHWWPFKLAMDDVYDGRADDESEEGHVHGPDCAHDHDHAADQTAGLKAGHVHGPDCAHDHDHDHGHVHGPGCAHNHGVEFAFSPDPSARLVETFHSYLLFSRIWSSGIDLERFPLEEGTFVQAALATRKPRLSQRYRDILKALENSHLSFLQVLGVHGPDLIQARDVMTGEEYRLHLGSPGSVAEAGGVIFGRVVTLNGISVCNGLAPAIFGDVLLERLSSLKAKLIEGREEFAEGLKIDMSLAPPNDLTHTEARLCAPILCHALVALLEPPAH